MNIIFADQEHLTFYNQMLEKAKNKDCYHRALFYCLGMDKNTREHLESIYSFKNDVIFVDALYEGWQTSGSQQVTRFAFNLWNGYVEEDEKRRYTPYALFDCPYARYMFEAIRLMYPEYTE